MSLQLPRFAKKNSLDAERETFEKTQATSLSKAINGQEVAIKEKHIRSVIIGTYQERGAHTFWECILRLPLKENPIFCWKFCHVLHKVLREGHDKVPRDSQKFKPFLQEHGRFWGHLKTGGYGELVKQYCALLHCKLLFHMKNPRVPGDLVIEEDVLFMQCAAEGEDCLFSLVIEMFDYLDCILDLQLEIFKSIDATRQSSMTNSGQCRLKPLIPCIQDSTKLYDFVTRLMFELHAKLSPDLLNGHRDRFTKVFKGLRAFYDQTMNLQYFKNYIEIHDLPRNPPNFLVHAELANYKPSSITVKNETMSEVGDSISEHLVSLDEGMSTNGSTSPDPAGMALYLEKDRQVKELEDEVERLKLELDKLRLQARTQFQQLHFEIEELKQELVEKKRLLFQRDEEINELLKHECKIPKEILELKEKSEVAAKSNEEKFLKMKELYSKLSSEHVVLLRKNATVEKELADTKKAINNQTDLGTQIEELRRENAVLETSLHATEEDKEKEVSELISKLKILEIEKKEVGEEQSSTIAQLETQLESKGEECKLLEQTILTLKSQVQNIESSKERLDHELNTVLNSKIEENNELKTEKSFLEEKISSLKGKLDDAETALVQLSIKFKDIEGSRDEISVRTQNLSQQLENFMSDELKNANSLLDFQIDKSSGIIKSEIEDLENPRVGPETGLRDFFMYHCEQFDESLRKLSEATSKGFHSPLSLNGITSHVEEVGHKVYFLLTYGGPLSRSGSDIQKGDSFLMEVRSFGNSALTLLKFMKERDLEKVGRGYDELRGSWRLLLESAKGVGVSLSPEADAAAVLEIELERMESAIDEAAKRMEEMLSASRASHSGVQLEVNEKLIDSCSSLMAAIRALVQKSKGLQAEIVAQGRGTASAKEFYKRNNQWTEGLISAAKAVGIGAKLLLESADKAVTSKGSGFEYLIASSQEIAASTIQLVVASQVRANRGSNNLALLKQASVGVKTATAHVIATAKDCAQLVEESDEMDVSKLSPHQFKRMELEVQAELLRQESDLEKSRRKLASLRQHHYHNSDG